MRFVREFVTLLAILSLAVVPVIGVGCTEQPPAKPVAEPTVDLGKKGDAKPAKKKGRRRRKRLDHRHAGGEAAQISARQVDQISGPSREDATRPRPQRGFEIRSGVSGSGWRLRLRSRGELANVPKSPA